jgi:hypothetical protein
MTELAADHKFRPAVTGLNGYVSVEQIRQSGDP